MIFLIQCDFRTMKAEADHHVTFYLLQNKKATLKRMAFKFTPMKSYFFHGNLLTALPISVPYLTPSSASIL